MSTLLTVFKKELLEFVRDRRTLFLALVFGPLLMPALMLAILYLADNKAKTQQEKPLEIAIIGAEHAPNLVKWLASQNIKEKTVLDPDAAILNKDDDLYIKIDPDFADNWKAGKPALIEIVLDATQQDAQIPTARVTMALQQYSQQVSALRLLSRGISPTIANPILITQKDISTPDARKGMALVFLPYLLILSSFLGGAYLIIDATAGERERQTLEPLLISPASRGAIVSGKILSASAVGLITLVLTLLALKFGAQLSPGIGRMMDVSMLKIAQMLMVLLPMLFIGTALLTWISAGAKSVKEAQSYMTFLTLMPMIPTIFLMVNPVKNQLWMFATPFLAQNQILLKIIRAETIEPVIWLTYFLSSFAVALLLWWLATSRYYQERLAIAS